MNRIIVDATTAMKLASVRKTAEVYDMYGKVLGRFVLAKRPEPQISQAEIERRERAAGGRSLKEIMADLEQRTNEK
jgi:hypothetical protein